jgi:hypothetical protein
LGNKPAISQSAVEHDDKWEGGSITNRIPRTTEPSSLPDLSLCLKFMLRKSSEASGNWQTANFLCIPIGSLYYYCCPVNLQTTVKCFLLIIFPVSPNRPQAEISGTKYTFSTSYTLLLVHTTVITYTPRVIYNLQIWLFLLLSLPLVYLQAAWGKNWVISISPGASNIMPITQ